MLRILSNIIDTNIQNNIRIAAIQHTKYVYFLFLIYWPAECRLPRSARPFDCCYKLLLHCNIPITFNFTRTLIF